MDHDKTLALLEKALEIAPGDWETRSHMASLCLDLGQFDRAATLLHEAPELPDAPSLKLEAADLCRRAGDADAALRITDALLHENRANARAHLLKARVYRDRGMQADARKHYNLAAVIDDSLEDTEFEQWLDGGNRPAPRLRESGGDDSSTVADSPFEIGEPDANAGNSESTQFPPSPLDDLEEDWKENAPSLEEASDLVARAVDNFADATGFYDPWEDDGPLEYGSLLPPVKFGDVGGMEDLKEKLRMKFIYPYKNESVFAKFRKRAGGGLLLYGPPGCGKTLIARATAGECDTYFHAISIPQILSKWLGESETRLHEAFEAARRHSPSIIFIDEIDALGARRSDSGGVLSSLVNVLLTEIDGAASNNADVLVLAATNTPWRIDPAFRRPGRFDQTVFVPPPDSAARESIFKLALSDLPTGEIDLARLAEASRQFSGADIRAAFDAAVELAIAEEMRTGKDTVLTEKMLLTSIKETRPSTLEWLQQASNHASYANQSGVYDELAEYLKSDK